MRVETEAIAKAWDEWRELASVDERDVDREAEHSQRDEIMLDLLAVLVPDLAASMRERAKEVKGYWYA